jgi:hypothetical protein
MFVRLHRVDFVWRLTAIWLSVMGAMVFIGFWILWLAPGAAQLTWSIGICANLAMAVACGACLAWYGRCIPVPVIAMIGGIAVSLSYDLLVFAVASISNQFSLFGVAGIAAFDVLSTAIGFVGLIALFLLGAPIGLIAKRIRPPKLERDL